MRNTGMGLAYRQNAGEPDTEQLAKLCKGYFAGHQYNMVSVITSVGHTDNNIIIVIISVHHTDTKFYYQCGILKLIQQMVPHNCPKLAQY